MILHLTNGKQMDIPSNCAEQILNAIQTGGPCVVFVRYENGQWWRRTVPMTSVVYVEQAVPVDQA